ncbi:4'-phosphopantetheinyl transferase family protein [Tabrizicola soli]|uniref:Enterobactin synthase component D n=1 Tax=Tabrizicola soli TaxID=2185115 RepID=A0ABV7DSK2_9RHOB
MTAVLRQAAAEAALARLFPPGVAVALVGIGAGELLPGEAAAVAGAVPARVAEFTAGRLAARRALAALGHPAAAIPAGPDRAPCWPEGMAGSIAHAAGVAVAAVRRGASLGLDVEADAGLEPDLWPLICDPQELAALPQGDRGRAVRLVFAAKEAVYKAQYPLTGRLIGFDAVRVTLEEDGFVARLRQGVGPLPEGHRLRGRILRAGGLVLAGVAT